MLVQNSLDIEFNFYLERFIYLIIYLFVGLSASTRRNTQTALQTKVTTTLTCMEISSNMTQKLEGRQNSNRVRVLRANRATFVAGASRHAREADTGNKVSRENSASVA